MLPRQVGETVPKVFKETGKMYQLTFLKRNRKADQPKLLGLNGKPGQPTFLKDTGEMNRTNQFHREPGGAADQPTILRAKNGDQHHPVFKMSGDANLPMAPKQNGEANLKQSGGANKPAFLKVTGEAKNQTMVVPNKTGNANLPTFLKADQRVLHKRNRRANPHPLGLSMVMARLKESYDP